MTPIAAQITRSSVAEATNFIIKSYIPGGASAIKQLVTAGIDSAIGGGSSMTGTYWRNLSWIRQSLCSRAGFNVW